MRGSSLSECGTYKTIKARFWPWLEHLALARAIFSAKVVKSIYVVPCPRLAVAGKENDEARFLEMQTRRFGGGLLKRKMLMCV